MAFEALVLSLENADLSNITQKSYFVSSTERDLLDVMLKKGPQFLGAITASESKVIQWNIAHSHSWNNTLVFLYPPNGTFILDYPICVMNIDAEGVSQFMEFITTETFQSVLSTQGKYYIF